MAHFYAGLPPSSSPYGPTPPTGTTVTPLAMPPGAMPAVPMTSPSTSYQGLLDRLHLANQAKTVPISPVLPPLPPAPSGLPSLSEILQRLKSFVTGLLEKAVPEATSPPPVSNPTKTPTRKTEFVISSFNVLGSSHTKGEGSNRPNMDPGTIRIRKVAELLKRHDVDVVGFQEFQRDQFAEFKKVAGKEYAIYPGVKLGKNGKPPKSMAIDWIFGTESMVTFKNYVRDRSPLVKQASDHPMIVSKAIIKTPKAG